MSAGAAPPDQGCLLLYIAAAGLAGGLDRRPELVPIHGDLRLQVLLTQSNTDARTVTGAGGSGT
jgi:hypothetical protein